MKQAIIYSRFSDRPRADDCDSNDKQEERCRSYCQAYGWEVVQAYRDDAISGKEASNRPALQAALKHAQKLKGAFVVYDISRFARDVIDGATIEKDLRKKGVDLVSVTEHIDCTTPDGRLMLNMKLSFAQYVRESNALRTSKAMLHHQKNGRRMSHHTPYGWKLDEFDPSLIIEDAAEQTRIELICCLRDRGAGLREICRMLEARGVRPRTGRRWRHTTICRILHRAAGAGSPEKAL